jgi:hypothetical protein
LAKNGSFIAINAIQGMINRIIWLECHVSIVYKLGYNHKIFLHKSNYFDMGDKTQQRIKAEKRAAALRDNLKKRKQAANNAQKTQKQDNQDDTERENES